MGHEKCSCEFGWTNYKWMALHDTACHGIKEHNTEARRQLLAWLVAYVNNGGYLHINPQYGFYGSYHRSVQPNTDTEYGDVLTPQDWCDHYYLYAVHPSDD